MKYMLDTNIIIKLSKGLSDNVKMKVNKNLGDMAISSITLAELVYGNHKASKKMFSQNTLSLMKTIAPFTVLPYDDSCVNAYGEIRADLESRGMMIGAMDLLIASHAKSLDMTVVTNNIREFQRVKGLKIEDWSLS
jgi:tRNA(fMet)-specific endonuclease VapC